MFDLDLYSYKYNRSQSIYTSLFVYLQCNLVPWREDSIKGVTEDLKMFCSFVYFQVVYTKISDLPIEFAPVDF